MSDEQISLLERYLLESDKEKFFATLVKNSETYVSMRLLDQINRHGLSIPAEGAAELKSFLGESKSEKTIIQFKHLLLEIEAQKDPAKRKDLIQKLNTKFLSISYNFSRPANIKQSEQLRTFGEVKNPTTFDGSKFDFDTKVENYFNQSDHMQIRTFRPQFLNRIDAKRVLDKSNDAFEYILNTLQSYSHIADLAKLLKTYITDKRKQNKGAVINSNYFQKMTIAQLEELKTALPEVGNDRNFISILFQKTFDMDLNTITEQDESDPVQYRTLLVRILAWLNQLPKQHTFLSFKSQVQREILQVDLENNNHNKDAFIDYLENPNNILDCFDTAQRNKLSGYCSYDTFWHSIHNIKTGNWTDEKKLIEEYLQHFFKTMSNFGEFEKYFSPTYLSRQYYTAKLLNGENVDNITKIFSESELTQLRESKKLKFVSWNKSRFHVGDEVTLHVEVKNIQNFCVNIFEINAESYYRKNKTEINERINLTGLIPSKVVEHNLTTAPIKSQVLEFKNLFDSRRGVYVVEFIGGGLSSRALIRIGALSLIRQVLSKGLLFHMIDERKSVCRSDKTDILVGDKVFRPDPALNWGILIPCTDKEINESAILRHEGFAELQHILVPQEQISFDMGLLFNEENLVSGAQLSLLMMPKLFVMGQDVSLITLKKVKAEVTSTNDIGINNTSNFDDVKIENGKDVTLSYLVPPKTESITVNLSGKFYSSAQEKEVDVSSTRTISINRYRERQIYYNYYLTQKGSNYILNFLGKNGEPLSNQKLSITFFPLFTKDSTNETFETDSKGQVHLGDLRTVFGFDVSSIDAPCQESVSCNYPIRVNTKISCLPDTFDIAEGEEICFPYAGDSFRADEYELVKVRKSNQASVTHDFSANIKNEEGAIYLTGLREGHYKFLYREHSKEIKIVVHKGTRWEASNEYLVKDRSVIRLLNQNLYLTYKNFQIANRKVSFQVRSNNLNNVQVHATAFTYFPSTISEIQGSLDSLRVRQDAEVFNLNSNSNVFLSEKSLSDEIKYVLERKRKNTFMGNTLDKPSSLLKRHFVRETVQDQETLKVERDYSAAKKPKAMHRQLLGGLEGRGFNSSSFSVNNLNTFLGKDGWSQFNITPDATGLVTFDLPADVCYGTLLIVIKDNKNSVIEVRPLESGDTVLKSVTLAESKKANKVYLYERLAHKLGNTQTAHIKDLAATELSMVEDVQTLYKMLKLISSDSQLDEWDFLAKWPSLSPEEQLKKYDKYISHELNLFAYFKDREFFELVVKPHITNKSTKQLIDHFLLGDEAQMKQYLNPVHLESLNTLEIALVVLFFKQTESSKAAAIAANLKAKVSTQYHDVKEFKRLFDTVLKAKAADAAPLFAQTYMAQAPAVPGGFNFGAPMMQQQQMPYMTQAALFTNTAAPFGGFAQQVQQPQLFGGFGAAGGPLGPPPSFNAAFGGFSNAAPNAGGGGLFGATRAAYPGPVTTTASLGFAASPRAAANPFANMDGAFPTDPFVFGNNYGYEQALDVRSPGVYDPSGYGGLPQAIERYRTLGVTNEYIEKQYYNNTTEHISHNKFWADYLTHITTKADQPFLSENFIYATSGLSEMLVVLALIDLPFEKGTHASESANNQLKLTAGSNCIVFTKEIQEKGDQKLDLEIMISQRFYDPFDRYIFSSDGQSRTLKNVDEFLVGKLYMSRVAITNSSDTQHEINVVTEIPQGSIPVVSLEYMKSTNMVLEHLSTQVVEFYFYFPQEGVFTCYPASINKDGCLVTTATGVDKLKVVRTRVATELKTISDILSLGNKNDILNFLEKENLHNTDIFNFADIYWLLEDPEFYKSVLELLRKRFIFDDTVWSFSLKHGDYETAKEYLNEYYFKNRTVSFRDGDELIFISSELAKLDKFDFKEYNPLVNPRVHDIGEFKHNILNRDFKAAYYRFLKYLFQKTFLTAKDYTYFATYLLLQDRIDDALSIYPHIKAEEIGTEMKIQYDYLSAYLDLYRDYPKFTKARTICNEYLTYPVFTWRNRFIDLVNQISEFDGDTDLMKKETDETDAEKNNRQAKKEEYISSELQGKNIKVTSKNISTFSVKFYKIDLEIMYSQDPFLSVDKNDYSYVTPNQVLDKNITASNEYTSDLVSIPEGLVTSNLIIQISSGGLSENLTYFPSSMKVFIVKNFGQIKVSAEDTEKPLSNIYIKTFAKKSNGTISFYKDGYTDLRGTFEYTSVSSSDLGDISEFSILVFSDKHGAQIKQVKPPSTVAKVEVNATKVVSTKMQLCQANQVSKASHKYAMF